MYFAKNPEEEEENYYNENYQNEEGEVEYFDEELLVGKEEE